MQSDAKEGVIEEMSSDDESQAEETQPEDDSHEFQVTKSLDDGAQARFLRRRRGYLLAFAWMTGLVVFLTILSVNGVEMSCIEQQMDGMEMDGTAMAATVFLVFMSVCLGIAMGVIAYDTLYQSLIVPYETK